MRITYQEAKITRKRKAWSPRFVLVQFEMPSSQERLPKQVAQGVCPSLLRPPPLKQDCIISPLGGCCPTWCDHLKSPKEDLCLTTNCTHGQGSPH